MNVYLQILNHVQLKIVKYNIIFKEIILNTAKIYYVSLLDEQGTPINNGKTDIDRVYGAVFIDENNITKKIFYF